MNSRVAAIWWLTCAIWSSVWLFIKIGVTAVPPISFAGLRLAIAAILLAAPAVLALRRFPVRRRDHAIIALTGFLLLGVNYALVFWGTQYISSGMTGTLQAATPAFGIAFAYLRERMRIGGRESAAAAIGLAGVAVVSADQLGIGGSRGLAGCIAVGAGAACVAVAYTVMKKELTHLPPVLVLFEQTIAGCVPLLIAGAIMDGNPLHFAWTRQSVAALAYLATAGSIAAFWLNLWLLQRTTAAAVLAMSIVEPLLAVALGMAVLHERVHAWAALGAALILVSIWLILRSSADRQPSAQENSGRGAKRRSEHKISA